MDVIIDGEGIKSAKDFHTQFAKAFDIEQFYGKNLHALRDDLLGGLERPIHIIWTHSELSRKALGIEFTRIISVFEEAKKDDEEFPSDERFTYELR